MLSLMAVTGAVGSGKTELAKGFCSYMASRRPEQPAPVLIGMSDPLIDMTAALLKHIGYNREDCRRLAAVDRAFPLPLLGGKTSRYIQQTLGVEWLRTHIDPDAMINILRHKVTAIRQEAHWKSHQPVLVTGIRTQEEAAYIRQQAGLIIEIKRPGVDHAVDHAIEAPVIKADMVLHNDGNIDAGVMKMVCIFDQMASSHTHYSLG